VGFYCRVGYTEIAQVENFFDSHNAAAATVDAPHGVQKEDEKPPQGNELKAPFGELVVTGRRQVAARADCGRTFARSHGHFDLFLSALKWACW
jgi:hypothetical protein